MPDSWWLKFKRAQRHMVEIRNAVRLYAERQPYTVSRVREPTGKSNIWRYRLDFDPPDPMLVLMLGDFVHNLRSALDHVAVACAPKKYQWTAGFPLTTKDAFALDSGGNFKDADKRARESYLRAIQGLSFRVKVMIAQAQPHRRDTGDVLGILGRIENFVFEGHDEARQRLVTGGEDVNDVLLIDQAGRHDAPISLAPLLRAFRQLLHVHAAQPRLSLSAA